MPSDPRYHPGPYTKKPVFDAAVKLARKRTVENIARAEIAAAAEVSDASVSNAFGSMPKLREAVAAALK